MAKGNLILGTARGKLGDIVLARRNGKQTSRPYISKVANPKTIGQQYQRMIFATAAAAAGALGDIVDHSFEGVKYGQDSRSKFMSANIEILRAKMLRRVADGWRPQLCGNYNIKGVKSMQPNALMISDGSLSVMPYVLAGETEGLSKSISFYDAKIFPEQIDTKEEYETFLANFGAVPGDQVTFLFLGSMGEDAATMENAANVVTYMTKARVVFLPWDNDTMSGETIIDTGTKVLNRAFYDAERSIGAEELRFFLGGDDSMNVATVASPIEVIAVGCIISRLVNGVWKRSRSYMAPSYGVTFRANGPDVVGSYGAGSIVTFPSDLYLNNADSAEEAVNTAEAGGYLQFAQGGWGASKDEAINAAVGAADFDNNTTSDKKYLAVALTEGSLQPEFIIAEFGNVRTYMYFDERSSYYASSVPLALHVGTTEVTFVANSGNASATIRISVTNA